ncbi:leucyl aminopeptidase [Psychrilyobacter atlanticus]|uniref:leucyl aminopeptidase n=1 Tax=Psychrilyobacter atlanticus TaxID=271091 RepID=UPI0003FF1023|nr:leucyl aminopeptidase [Psychrilyobacter atlanticus]
MNINLVKDFNKIYDAYVMPKFEGEVHIYDGLTDEEKIVLERLIEKKEFTGKKKTSISCELMHKGKLVNITYIGLGKRDKLKTYDVIEAFYKELKGLEGEILVGTHGVEVTQVVEAVHYAKYDFDKYKTDKKEKKESNFDIFVEEDTDAICEGVALAEAVMLTRDLVNEPANVIFPESLAHEVKTLGKKYEFEVEIFDEEKITELKMEAFLSVARAAEKRPKFIVMRHLGDPSNPTEIHGLVGKGLTYDTGGLSLKPSAGMANMKTDMGGAATVIGAMCALSRMKVKKNIVTVVAACENSIGGNAYRPGDIIGSMGGKTIEVDNTDAEGRLTLIDAVHYIINHENVKEVIDVATLTGAVLVALGMSTTGVLANNDEMYKDLERASETAGERVWRLPNFPEYKELYKSKIADLKNTGGRFAGSITAGMFIEEFVGETPWMHLDIAGTSCADAPYGYYTHGGTGQIVRTLYNYYLKK